MSYENEDLKSFIIQQQIVEEQKGEEMKISGVQYAQLIVERMSKLKEPRLIEKHKNDTLGTEIQMKAGGNDQDWVAQRSLYELNFTM